MRFLLKALTRMPLPVLYAVGTFIYVVLFHLVRWRRDQVESDIARAFPDKSPAERARILQQSYRNIADSLRSRRTTKRAGSRCRHRRDGRRGSRRPRHDGARWRSAE